MEYKYITQENIDEGVIRVNSAEEYEEADRYNDHMMKEYRKRRIIGLATNIWFVMQFTAFFFAMYGMIIDPANAEGFSPFVPIGAILFLVSYTYFVVIRKQRTPLVAFLTTVPLLLIKPGYLLIIVPNTILAYFYDKYEKTARQDPGYPGFARITVAYLRPDPDEMSFDKIREKAQTDHPYDEGFL